jgi:hypothetical protein
VSADVSPNEAWMSEKTTRPQRLAGRLLDRRREGRVLQTVGWPLLVTFL